MKIPKAWRKHLETIGAKGGLAKSEAKKNAARENLKKANAAKSISLPVNDLQTIEKNSLAS